MIHHLEKTDRLRRLPDSDHHAGEVAGDFAGEVAGDFAGDVIKINDGNPELGMAPFLGNLTGGGEVFRQHGKNPRDLGDACVGGFQFM